MMPNKADLTEWTAAAEEEAEEESVGSYDLVIVIYYSNMIHLLLCTFNSNPIA